jgi:hypothetical protein
MLYERKRGHGYKCGKIKDDQRQLVHFSVYSQAEHIHSGDRRAAHTEAEFMNVQFC